MKNHLKKYLIESLISVVILCVLIFLSVFYVENRFVFFLIFVALLISEKICIRIFAQKDIYSIMYRELDPELFLSIDNSKYFHLQPIYKSLGKMSHGAYQEAVDICTSKFKQAKNKAKSVYLGNLARIYFELDDVDVLNEICKQFTLYSEENTNLLNKYPVFSFYQYYIEGEYNECIKFCKHRLEKYKNKSDKYNLVKLNNYFNLAVSYYKNNDIADAKKWFEKIVLFAPKMHIAEVSKRYLDTIEKGEISAVKFPKVIPNENYQDEENHSFRKLKLLKRVAYLLIIVSAAIYIVLSIVNPSKPSTKITEFEKQLNAAVDVNYDNFKLLGYCNVEMDGVVVDVIALIYSENKIDVVSYVSYDGTKAVEKRITDIQPDKTYSFESTTQTHQLFVSLIDSDLCDDERTKIEFEIDKKHLIFVVEQITPLNEILNLQYMCKREKRNDSQKEVPYNSVCENNYERISSHESLPTSSHKRAGKQAKPWRAN